MGGAGLLYLENQLQPLTESQINKLDRKNVNWLDRPATRYYSKRAGDISDWGMFTALLMPLAFFADKSMHADALPVLKRMAKGGGGMAYSSAINNFHRIKQKLRK